MQTHTHTSFDHLTVLGAFHGPRTPVHVRGPVWHIVMGVLVATAIAYGILSQSWGFSIVCALLTGLYVWIHKHQDDILTLSVAKEGLALGETFVHWEQLEGYWAVPTHTGVDIHLPLKSPRHQELRIQLSRDEGGRLGMLLSQHTQHLHQHREHLIDTICRICKL